jgi:hypothetical protein
VRWLARLLAPQFFFLFFPAPGLSCPHAVDTCDMRVRCVSCTVRCRVGHLTVAVTGMVRREASKHPCYQHDEQQSFQPDWTGRSSGLASIPPRDTHRSATRRTRSQSRGPHAFALKPSPPFAREVYRASALVRRHRYQSSCARNKAALHSLPAGSDRFALTKA